MLVGRFLMIAKKWSKGVDTLMLKLIVWRYFGDLKRSLAREIAAQMRPNFTVI